jgi:4-hydroxythreonine-4-phosphate dehydrogenase
VRGGVLYLDGVALHQTDAWRAEALQAPTSIAGALKGVATASLPLAKIRGASARAAAAAAIQQARIVICDAETPADLTCIAALALSLGANLAGASALAKALAHRLRDRVPTIPVDATVSLAYPERPLLFIVGTAAIMARRQLDRLAAEGVRLLEVDPASGRIEGQAPEMVILAALAQGPVALSFPADAEVLPGAGRNAVRHLATMAAGVIGELDRPPNLFLSGGETARAVLDALGIDSLVPIEEIDHGAVCSEAPSGQRIITRPGSFGDENGLVRVLHRLKPASSLSQHLSKVHQEASKS